MAPDYSAFQIDEIKSTISFVVVMAFCSRGLK